MTASEFAFMALGLVLGGASGAALVFVIGSRPQAPREIRLTVGRDAIPRRVPATLSTDGVATATAEPARGGPADRRSVDRPLSAAADQAAAIPAGPVGTAEVPVSAPAVLVTSSRVGIPIHREADPAIAAIRAGAPVAGSGSMGAPGGSSDPEPWALRPQPVPSLAIAAVLDRQRHPAPEPASGRTSEGRGGTREVPEALVGRPNGGNEAPSPSRADEGNAGQRAPSQDERCAAAEAIADERCRQADVAHLGAERAADAAAATQRDYDELRAQADRARSVLDPRALQELKETARLAFRAARRSAVDRASMDAAARTWLTTINLLNGTAREATSTLGRAEAAALRLVPTLERLAAESDAARVASDGAAEACREARSVLADCREAAAGDRRAAETMERLAAAVTTPSGEVPLVEPDSLGPESGMPIVMRIVQGDRDARSRVAAALLREHGEPERPWADLLAEFADGVRMRAIEESLIDLPGDHPFWGQFAGDERREVVRALSALGYRYDGLGGWMDDSAPNQRDLSRAVGYAGQDPMRVRHWPDESAMADLLTDAHVAADEYLRQAAGDLSLGEVVDMLGARADPLTGLWDAWATVQALLRAPWEDTSSG